MGLKNQLWFRHHHHWVEIFWKVVPQGQHTEAVVQRRSQLDPKLAAEHRNVYWFWRPEGVVENNLVPKGQPQLQEIPQNWRSHREKLRSGTVRGQDRPLVKLQPQLQWRPQNIGAVRTVEWPKAAAEVELAWISRTRCVLLKAELET